MKKTWWMIYANNNKLYFRMSPQKIYVFDVLTGEGNVISFKQKITNTVIQNNKLYVITGVDIECDIETWQLISEGEINVFLID